MWKKNENIDFDFCDCQLEYALASQNEDYIKRTCRKRLDMVGTYIMLIGQDTRSKHKYVRWEAEVALEKKCRIIGVNLDNCRRRNPATCPPVIDNVGAIFVPFSAKIIQHALEKCTREESGNRHYEDNIYTDLGYKLIDDRAIWQRGLASTLLSSWMKKSNP